MTKKAIKVQQERKFKETNTYDLTVRPLLASHIDRPVSQYEK